MNFRDDQRAVTVQVGFILLFGVLILSLSMYQVQVVPVDNERAEFDHNQRVQQDMVDTRNAILRSASTATMQPVSVSLGARYPNRVFFVNPPPASGRLSTTEPVADGITITNARAVDAESADYWTGEGEMAFETQALEYTPDYTQYQNPPTTVYEHSVVYNRFDNDASLPQSGQTLVNGKRISLVALDGELSAERIGTEPLDAHPVSASTRTTTVTSEGGPIKISLATGLSEDQWEELLEDEEYVTDVSVDGDTLTVTLEAGERYSLRMSKVGVGSGASEEEPRYITVENGDGASVNTDGTQRIVAEVRDRFGNPVSNVPVSVTEGPSSGRLEAVSSTTDEEGRAVFRYEAGSATGVQSFELGFDRSDDGAGTTDAETVRFSVGVGDGSGIGSGSTTVRTLLDTSFERGSLGAEGWTGEGAGRPGVDTAYDNSGRYAAYVGGEDRNGGGSRIVSPTMDTTGAGYLDVEYWIAEDAPEPDDRNEQLVVEFYAANGTWVTVEELEPLDEPGTTYDRRVMITDPGAFHDEFALRFRQPDASSFDRWYVDDVRVFGVGSGASEGDDSGDGTGSNPGLPGQNTKLRVDDLTGLNGNDPRLVVSYDVGEVNDSFERVEIDVAATDGNPSTTSFRKDSPRGSVRYEPGYGTNEEFTVTVRTIYRTGGDDVVGSVRTFTDVADGRTPTEKNADLSRSGQGGGLSISVDDNSRVQGNRVDYEVDYNVRDNANFQRVEVAWVSQSSSAPTETRTLDRPRGTNVRYSVGYGTGEEYRIGVLVYDDDGVVVDTAFVTDTADGEDP